MGSAASPLERAIADIQGGGTALAFECGQSALDAILDLLLPGSRILVPHDWWDGSWTRGPHALRVEPIGYSIPSIAELERTFRPGTSALVVASPSGPSLASVDYEAVAAWSHRKGILLVVDNAGSLGERPGALDLGADVAIIPEVRILTGEVPTRSAALVTRDPELNARLQRVRDREGSEPTSGDSWLAAQGVRTHPFRIEAAARSAARIGDWLETQVRVKRVHRGPGGSADLAIELGEEWIVPLLLGNLRLWKRGGIHGVSTIEHPATGSLRRVPSALLRRAGIPDTLVRLRVGPEETADLIHDLGQAFAASSDALDYVI